MVVLLGWPLLTTGFASTPDHPVIDGDDGVPERMSYTGTTNNCPTQVPWSSPRGCGGLKVPPREIANLLRRPCRARPAPPATTLSPPATAFYRPPAAPAVWEQPRRRGARVAHCATSDLGGQPRAPRVLPLLLSCSPHPKLRPVALYDRALALPCPIAPFRPPASRQHVPPLPRARPPDRPPTAPIAAAPLHLTLPPSACGAGSAPGYPAHAPRVAPSRLHGQGCSVRAGARGRARLRRPGPGSHPIGVRRGHSRRRGRRGDADDHVVRRHGLKRRVCRRGTGGFLLRLLRAPAENGVRYAFCLCFLLQREGSMPTISTGGVHRGRMQVFGE